MSSILLLVVAVSLASGDLKTEAAFPEARMAAQGRKTSFMMQGQCRGGRGFWTAAKTSVRAAAQMAETPACCNLRSVEMA